MDARYPAGVASLSGEWHETRLGVRLAIADGGGDLRHHPDRLRARAPAALWPGTERNGSGDRDHDHHHCDRITGRQNFVLPVGTISPSTLGHRAHVIPTVPSYGKASACELRRKIEPPSVE